MSEWQQIETAPRDGKQILGLNNRGNISVIYWNDMESGWAIPFTDLSPNLFWNGRCGSVSTHWMELPSPPQEEQ